MNSNRPGQSVRSNAGAKSFWRRAQSAHHIFSNCQASVAATSCRAAGIETVLERRNVGENLQDHLQLRCAYKVTGIPTLNEKANRLLGKAAIALEYLISRSGPMSMAPSQLGVFTRSDPSFETANLQYHVQPLSLEKFGENVHPFPAFTASVCNLRPESRGSVHVKSPDHRSQPAIQPNYLTTASDRHVAADSIRITRNIVAQKPLQRFKPEEFKPGPDYQTEEELVEAAGAVGTTIFHPVGTCRMGADPRLGRRSAIARARHSRSACGRCLDHAVDHLGQYQLANDHDRRKGRRDDREGLVGYLI